MTHLTAAGVYTSRQISLLRYSWLITCLFSTLKQSVKQAKRYLRGVTKLLYMRDIFETSHIRVRVVYGGHRLRTKSTSWVLASFAHEFRFLSRCYFDVEGRNSSLNFTLMASFNCRVSEFRFLSRCYFDVEGRNSSLNFTLMASFNCRVSRWQMASSLD